MDQALEAGLDAARKARRWGDVVRLAAELEARAAARSAREARAEAGVVELSTRRGRR